MFQFRPFPSYAYLIQRTMTKYCLVGFPHSEIHGFSGYLLLPVAYRSLSRPSSAPDAKAFPLRTFSLNLLVLKNYAGNSTEVLRLEIATLHLSVFSTIKTLNLLLPCFSLLLPLFSFQGTPLAFETR